MYFLPILNLAFALGGLGLAAGSIVLAFDLFYNKGAWFGAYVERYFWQVVMGITIGSVVFSLLYSEYFGFVPCSLCWLQRIAIYPQALLSVLAFKKNDITHFPLYGIWLSLFGLVVALYQYVYQILPKETVSGLMPCLADDLSADCAVKVIDEFGFVAFPFISAATFAFLIILYLYIQKRRSV